MVSGTCLRLGAEWALGHKSSYVNLKTFSSIHSLLITDQVEMILARDYKNKIGEGKLKKECDEWINFTTLLARCIEAGVIAEYEFRWELCCMDINKALERDLPHGIRRDCLLMGAAQYVLLAGRTLSVDCYKDPFEEMEGWFAGGYVEGPVRWRRWADRFKEISREENGNPRIASVTKQAHEHMVSLHPELFGDDDDVAIEEPGDDHKDG